MANWNNNISVYLLDWNNWFFFVPISAAASLCIMLIMQGMEIPTVLVPVSTHTIFVLGTHYLFVLGYKWLSAKILIDSLLFCIPVLVFYTIVLNLYEKNPPKHSVAIST